MANKCDCGASAVNSPGHSDWCSSLKPDEELDGTEELNRMWEEEMAQVGLHPLHYLEDDEGETD